MTKKNLNHYKTRDSQIFQKFRRHLQILENIMVYMKEVPYWGSTILERHEPRWHFLLSACELVHIFVHMQTKWNNYVQNFRCYCTKFSGLVFVHPWIRHYLIHSTQGIQYTRLFSYKSISERKGNISMVPLFTKKKISDSYKIKLFCYQMLVNYNVTN
jgi:hypothetical protein